MLRNYLLTAVRSIKRHWALSLINVLGLATGLAAFLLIFNYTSKELSFDSFHKDVERIYRISMKMKSKDREPYHTAATFSGVAPRLVEEMPEVLESCRLVKMGWGKGGFVRFEDKNFEFENIYYVDSTYFDLFSLELINGNPKKVLTAMHSVAISETLANLYFGEEDAVGQVLTINSIDGITEYTITGVFKNRQDTHLSADILVSMRTLLDLIGMENGNAWNWFDYVTYVKLAENVDLDNFNKKLPPFVDKHGGERLGSDFVSLELQPISDIHLHSNINQEISANGDFNTVIFLLIVAVVILITAWINYINMYTAQATERIKELGIRKALGSDKTQLRAQFLIEAGIINLSAIFIGMLLLWLAIPLFNSLTGEALIVASLFNWEFVVFLVALFMMGTLLTGIYPAIMISDFKTLDSLKQKGANSSTGRLRKALVVGQFAVSAGLISWTAITYSQYNFMNDQDLGIRTSQTLVLNAPDLFRDNVDHTRKLKLLRNRLNNYNQVKSVSISSDVPGQQIGWRGSTYKIGADTGSGDRSICFKMVADENYFTLFENHFIAGRTFVSEADSDKVIVNSKALELYNISSAEEAIGEHVWFAGLDTFEIVGVIDNYFQETLKEDFKPTTYFIINQELTKISIKLIDTNNQNIADFEKEFKATFPEVPFSYSWIDDDLKLRHKSESTFFNVFKVFTGLTLFISFLGLVSLSYFMAEKRVKEIGIRKVLGATVPSIMNLILRDIVLLVVIGNLIIMPFVICFGNTWLSQFAFHTDFSYNILVYTFIATACFAIFSTTFHVLKAAVANPVNVLRSE